ncbi:MAG: hypothetical protein JXA96_16010 [Sedimentisphaerales bacterium]|nr:hypothetical protein [Sedimentisphaerales bacterium]
MKPSKGFMITVLFILGILMFKIAILSNFKKKMLSSRNNQIMMYIEKIEEFKDALKNNPDEVVTKADLADFTEMNFYQSQIDKLYMENDLELAKGYPMVFPDYVILILILWLSFQLDKIYKQINKSV